MLHWDAKNNITKKCSLQFFSLFFSLTRAALSTREKEWLADFDDAARIFPVRNEISNPGGEIKAGMLGRAALRIGEPKKAVLIPKNALVLSAQAQAVCVVVEEVARLLLVETGAEHGLLIEVKGDLKAGSKVVVWGTERLRPGQPVKIVSGTPPGGGGD
jgi:multidrug efflux pump subunit AcrA (membrane-fusion protein)